jgi:hypothetical protein
MARVHFVKKARKDNAVCKKGESYYYWTTRVTVGKSYHGQKHFSKTSPKRSQLTNSDFLAQIYDIEDDQIGVLDAKDFKEADEIASEASNIADCIRQLGDEQSEKLSNMPEGLQQGSTGEMIQERMDECENMASQIEGIDFNFDGDPDDFDAWVKDKIGKIQEVSYGGP